MSKDDDVEKLYAAIRELDKKLDKLSKLQSRIEKVEKHEAIIIDFILNLRPILTVLKTFNLFKLF
jgi:hypothetical protein